MFIPTSLASLIDITMTILCSVALLRSRILKQMKPPGVTNTLKN